FCSLLTVLSSVFFFQAEDGIRDRNVTGVQTCALPILFLAYGYVGMGPYGGGQAEYLRVPFADYNCVPLPAGEEHETDFAMLADRSEERRVGKKCSSRWGRDEEQKKNE